MGKRINLARVVFFTAISMAAVFVLSGCLGNRVDTSRIDCQLDDIAITHTLVGTVSVSGDTVTGTITITCAGAPVPDVTIEGSAGWWNIVSIGPSDAAGVISVARPAESLGNSDINTSKTVDIIVNAFEGGDEDSRTFSISIPIT